MYEARVTWTNQLSGATKVTYLYDNALLYLVPVSMNIVSNFVVLPLPTTNLAYSLFKTSTEMAIGSVFDLVYEKEAFRIQFFEICAWVAWGQEYLGTDEYYWQSLDMINRIRARWPQ